MVLQLTVADVMTQPVLTVTPDTPLQQAVQMISDHHVSGLPVVDAEGRLIGELTEQDLMVRESGVDAGPYVMLLDSVIYLRNLGTSRAPGARHQGERLMRGAPRGLGSPPKRVPN
ncbi:MAG: hypothetical protein CM15mP39_09990 [Synechococcus sp.]|nr:MAG: hypothetical protein CM15mP39_09990 [Synechococcus sp.]